MLVALSQLSTRTEIVTLFSPNLLGCFKCLLCFTGHNVTNESISIIYQDTYYFVGTNLSARE